MICAYCRTVRAKAAGNCHNCGAAETIAGASGSASGLGSFAPGGFVVPAWPPRDPVVISSLGLRAVPADWPALNSGYYRE